MDFVFAVVGGVLLVVAIIVLFARAAKKRREALEAFAIERGWSFAPKVPSEILDAARAFEPLDSRRGKAFNYVGGEADGMVWSFFEFEYRTDSGDEERQEGYGIALANVRQSLPAMRIRPSNLGHKLAAMVGFKSVQTGNEAFDKAFHVRAGDEAAALAWLQPPAMEWLLEHPGFQCQTSGAWIAVNRPGRYGPSDIERITCDVGEFLARLPRA